MFADPQSVTINAVANSLPRTAFGTNSGTFTKDDGLVKLSITHNVGKRSRRVVRLDHAKIAADPLLAGVNVKANMAAYLVIDTPETGYTLVEARQVVEGLVDYLVDATLTKVLGQES